ncbi:MAG: VWA-like domain-containing protein [Bacteroidota bacterium]
MSSSDITAVLDFLRFARAYSVQHLPFFAPALFRTTIRLTEQVPIAAIDQRMNVYWNPAVVQDIQARHGRDSALAQLGFIWIHEISHLLREHADRAKDLGAEARLWNVAADLEINDGNWPHLTMPVDYPGLLAQKFNLPTGQLAEWYYRKLEQPSGETQVTLAWGDEGSGVHGQLRPWELDIQEADLNQAINQVTLDLVRQEVAEAMESTQIGKLPGSWQRWVKEKLQPKIDWRKVLQNRVRMSIQTSLGGKADYTHARPNRRQNVYQPFLMPSLRGDLQARISVVVDTSGSMSPQMLAQAVGEVCGLLETFHLPVTVIPCDARAYDAIEIRDRSDYLKLNSLAGGGGTNMIAGVDAALEERPTPDAIIVLTDGYTPWPPPTAKVSIIFGVFHQGRQDFPLPPMPPHRRDAVVGIDLTTL